uniref:Oxysterol-binding protein n=1 Tax=Melanopsichium pennsylvanicum 4 TaxID=1398559 RepID=A0A077R3T0_9BASI|nr:oxysterol-binding protein [Melanopsichium pennsylvanicum 4]
MHHDATHQHHSQGRHYTSLSSPHRSHNQYRYSHRSYSPAPAAPPSISSPSHHAHASLSRLEPSSSNSGLASSNTSSASHPADRDHDSCAPFNDTATNAASTVGTEKKISCMECRLSKVKCSGGDLCIRCKRLGKTCYYKSHKRGRKSDSSKIQKLERTVETLSRTLEQFSRNKRASSPANSKSLPNNVHIESTPVVPSQPLSDQDLASSPDASCKGVEAAQLSAPSSSSAMSPPSQSPRAILGSAYRDAPSNKPRRPSELFDQPSASSSWQTHKNITSATPTSDDPDEPENLGLPTLSNPLKLLAHASDSARDRDSGLETDFSSISTSRSKVAIANSTNFNQGNHRSSSKRATTHSADQRPSSSGGDPNIRASLFGVYAGTTASNAVSRFGPGRGKAFFDVGLFNTKLDNLPHFDPINRGYLTLVEAESLYALYMQHINPMITLLDPYLHTFDHVRSCSALLLSSTCWIAAKYRVEASQIAAHLEMHIRSNLLPTILMEGFRNAEIPQALIILAAYHPQMNTLSEDKAWAYVGFAIRIASELDMNSRISVRPANRQDDESLARRLRNRERTWLNLWLFETSMSQHMGRRPTLANDPVVMACAHWHLDKFALPADKAVVAVVQLRLTMLRNIELFENFVDASINHLPVERTTKQVELFRRICASDLDIWLATWTTSEIFWPNTHLPPTLSRIHRLKLYYWYARLILDTIALKCSHLGLTVLGPIYKDAYACCMAYLGIFVATMVPNGLFWGHNSTVVTPVYCAIFALRIVGLISMSAGASSLQVKSQPMAKKDKHEKELSIDIDAEYTFEMVEKVAKVCEEAGNATPHRRGAAGSYAVFLFTVLSKARVAWKSKTTKKEAQGATAALTPAATAHETEASCDNRVEIGNKRNRDADDGTRKNGKVAKMAKTGEDKDKNAGNKIGVVTGSVQAPDDPRNGIGTKGRSLSSSTTATASGEVDSDQHHLLRQLMQFQPGPSGVQTAILPNHSNSAILLPQYSHPLPPRSYPTQLMPTTSEMTPMAQFDASHQIDTSAAAASNAASASAFGASGNIAGVGGVGGDHGMNGESNRAEAECETAAAAGGGGGGGVVGGGEDGHGRIDVDIDWDFGMLDGFLGDSLFSDMSFISVTPGKSGRAVGN